MTRLFSFDPSHYAASFGSKGYVHIPRGLTPAFLATANRQVDQRLQGILMANFALGDKQQALYDFPDEDYFHQFLDAVGTVCSLNADKLVVSERHIKAYEADADPHPLPHKDRFATQVAVGFSIQVPSGSTLVLYPHADRSVNHFNSAKELRQSLRPEQLPEVALHGAERVEIQDGPGDVMLFRGNSMWHWRERPAGTVMLYFKLNAFHCDPLGEDPRSAEYQTLTRQQAAAADQQFESAIPVVGRRVDYIHHRYNRHWKEMHGVVLWGEQHFTIDDEELLALKAMDGQRSVRAVVEAVSGDAQDADLLLKIRQLAKRRIVDLLPATVTDKSSPAFAAARGL